MVIIAAFHEKAKLMYAKIAYFVTSSVTFVIFFFVLSFSYAINPKINKSNYYIKGFVLMIVTAKCFMLYLDFCDFLF
jgi:hypothetical protein